ncbi:MAG: exo-alpha-sialidase [Pirellulaceae bacterium]
MRLHLICLGWLLLPWGDSLLAQETPVVPITDHRLEIWDAQKPLPSSAECEPIDGVQIRLIKAYEPKVDSYDWLHGVALAVHRGRLFASFGHNRGLENTASEEARYSTSNDVGQTWSPVQTIDVGAEENLAVSHGVFLETKGQLWAFHGAFYNRLEMVHTRGYLFDDASQRWQQLGEVIGDGFWPMQAPQRIGNQWVMAGLQIVDGLSRYNDSAAVAICASDDLTDWQLVVIPKPPEMDLWGESTIFTSAKSPHRVWNIARYRQPRALAAFSDDRGRSWSTLAETNLSMSASKPYAGVLPSGVRYLIGTTTSDSGNRRSPLTIALSAGADDQFSKVMQIRDARLNPPLAGLESGEKIKLSYPYAIVHEEWLLVGYSNDGGRGANRNSAELALIPIASLGAD